MSSIYMGSICPKCHSDVEHKVVLGLAYHIWLLECGACGHHFSYDAEDHTLIKNTVEAIYLALTRMQTV